MVIGGVDTGKSTLCLNLLNFSLKIYKKVAFIDSDIGQSDIGPPTTVGLSILKKPINAFEEAPIHSLYFVGALSPEGVILEVVMGVQHLANIARREGAECIIINTSGLIHGEVGKKLKWHKIIATSPDKIVALHREDELEHILKVVEALNSVKIDRIKVEGISRKDPFFRRKRREEKFREYFSSSIVQKIPFDGIKTLNTPLLCAKVLPQSFLDELSKNVEEVILHGERTKSSLYFVMEEEPSTSSIFRLRSVSKNLHYHTKEYFLKTVVGLLDRRGELLSIGVVEDIDFFEKILYIRTKKDVLSSEVAIINFGNVKLDFSTSHGANNKDNGYNS